MSSQQRDPYPMNSAEAAALEGRSSSSHSSSPLWSSSLSEAPTTTTGAAQWSRMSTTTTIDLSDIMSGDGMDEGSQNNNPEASTQLVGKQKGRGKKTATATAVTDAMHHLDTLSFGNDADPADDEDDFLDQPLWYSRQGKWKRRILLAMERLYKRLYGDDLPVSEMLRTLCLATTLFFMIGGYWLFRSLKDAILISLCGVEVIPKAKMLSVAVVLLVVSIYNHFLESDIPKHQLFYIFGTFYGILFTTIALLLMHPTIGLANQKPSPWRVLGWISYCSIESFGSVMVSLFWSFANSNISLATAKASYGVMVATAQLGSILGPTLVQWLAPHWGPANCYLLGALTMMLLQGTMRMYIRIYGVSAADTTTTTSPTKKNKKKQGIWEGIIEGLVLFRKYNYVKGIFAISCLFMVAGTIVDFTLKVLAQNYFAEAFPCQEHMSCWDQSGAGQHGISREALGNLSSFMGFFGQVTNTFSFLLSLFGTSAVIRYLGLRLTLLLFPSLLMCIIFTVRMYPTLYVVFGAMMVLKANSYALNNPTKEILYQPTSPAVKYKAKSWIDIFGARGSKALGSVVTNAFSDSTESLISNGTLVGMGVAAFLIWNATYMGRKFDEYTASGYVVGGEQDHDDRNTHAVEMANDESDHVVKDQDVAEQHNVRMASQQNDLEDTSCAILEEEEEEDDDDNDDAIGIQEEGQDKTENAASPKMTMV